MDEIDGFKKWLRQSYTLSPNDWIISNFDQTSEEIKIPTLNISLSENSYFHQSVLSKLYKNALHLQMFRISKD